MELCHQANGYQADRHEEDKLIPLFIYGALAPQVGVVNACEVLGVARASYYRYQARDDNPPLSTMRSRSPRALSEAERQQVLELLHSERFVDQAPPAVYATLPSVPI